MRSGGRAANTATRYSLVFPPPGPFQATFRFSKRQICTPRGRDRLSRNPAEAQAVFGLLRTFGGLSLSIISTISFLRFGSRSSTVHLPSFHRSLFRPLRHANDVIHYALNLTSERL